MNIHRHTETCCQDRVSVWLHPAELHELADTIAIIRRWLNWHASDETVRDLTRHVRELEGRQDIGAMVVFDQLNDAAGVLHALLNQSRSR